jgi:hypothetical protein
MRAALDGLLVSYMTLVIYFCLGQFFTYFGGRIEGVPLQGAGAVQRSPLKH